MKKILILLTAVLVMFSTASVCWGWLIYYKPAFRGRIIDTETKAPIEGAVVVVSYNKTTLVGGPGGLSTDTFDVRETLTDETVSQLFFDNRILEINRKKLKPIKYLAQLNHVSSILQLYLHFSTSLNSQP
ncbi:MAG TPA: hypothetical protein VEF33_14645 [Syntrophales bacterium]|nr:hypothetical protein [Syntrophales bacterium]